MTTPPVGQQQQAKSIQEFFQAARVQKSCKTVEAVASEIIGNQNFGVLGFPQGLKTVFAQGDIVPSDSSVAFEEIGFILVVQDLYLSFASPGTSTKANTTLNLNGDAVPVSHGLLQIDGSDAGHILHAKTELAAGSEQSPMKLVMIRRGQLIAPLIRSLPDERLGLVGKSREKSVELKNAISLIPALSILGEILAMQATFEVPYKATLAKLEGAVKGLQGIEKHKTETPNLLHQQYEGLIARFQINRDEIKQSIDTATMQIREKLNLASGEVLRAKFSPQGGVIIVDWKEATPAQFLAGADLSKLTWEIAFGTTVPSNGNDISLGVESLETRSGSTTNAEIRREGLKHMKNLQVWARARCASSIGPNVKLSIASAVWAVADVLTLDTELATRFKTLFTLTGKPTVSLTGSLLKAEWAAVLPTASTTNEFRRVGEVKWEIVISPTNNPADTGAVRDLLPISSTNKNDENPKYSSMKSIFFHVRAVIDVGMPGLARLEGPWAVETCKRPPSNTLGPGESLARDEYLISYVEGNPSEENVLALQGDGNFVLYRASNNWKNMQAVWAAGSNGDTARATMQQDGNLVLYHDSGYVPWSSGTNKRENEGASLILEKDGNVIIRTKTGEIAWATHTKRPKPIIQITEMDRIHVGETLLPGQELVSPNGRYHLILQTDGNFVLYDNTSPLWHIDTNPGNRPERGELGEDDNFVVVRSGGNWETNTRRAGGGRGALIVRNDGVAVIVSDGTIIWATDMERERKPIPEPKPDPTHDEQDKGSRLTTGSSITTDQRLTSPNGAYWFVLQGDGNLVLYRMLPAPQTATWASDTNWEEPDRLTLEENGDLVLYRRDDGSPCWSSETSEYGERRERMLELRNDGNLVLLDQAEEVWSTETKE